jgi:hypothetical protein
MTCFVVTGSRPPKGGYTLEDIILCQWMFRFWQSTDTLVQGGCIGVDAIAMAWAHKLGMEVISILPSHQKYTDWPAVHAYSTHIIETTLGYWARDKQEVDRGDKVIALPLHERAFSSRLSGTWHTWDIAGPKQSVLRIIRPFSYRNLVCTGPDAALYEEQP